MPFFTEITIESNVKNRLDEIEQNIEILNTYLTDGVPDEITFLQEEVDRLVHTELKTGETQTERDEKTRREIAIFERLKQEAGIPDFTYQSLDDQKKLVAKLKASKLAQDETQGTLENTIQAAEKVLRQMQSLNDQLNKVNLLKNTTNYMPPTNLSVMPNKK